MEVDRFLEGFRTTYTSSTRASHSSFKSYLKRQVSGTLTQYIRSSMEAQSALDEINKQSEEEYLSS
jgi:hypothetical protein